MYFYYSDEDGKKCSDKNFDWKRWAGIIVDYEVWLIYVSKNWKI